MPRKLTIGDLVLRCKQRADMENADFITDSEWKGLLSSAYAHLHSILVASGLRYFEATEIFTPDFFVDNENNGGQVELPCDFLGQIGVDRREGKAWCQLEESMVQERNLRYCHSNRPRAFDVVGCYLNVYPLPKRHDVRLVYVPQPVDISTADDDAFLDVVTPDGESFLVWHVAVNALSKEESDVRVALSERDTFEGRVREWAVLRAINTPRRYVTQHQGSHLPGDYGYGRYE